MKEICFQEFPLKVSFLYLGNNGLNSLASDLLDWDYLVDFQFSGKLKSTRI
jgi:hypothetical protein